MAPQAHREKLGDPTLLDKIDKLLAANLGDHIDLPQLVVVGDQSSGKSSVLEGLTKLPFPRDSGLCTRFATQIIFRRSKDGKGRKITASIIPASDTDPECASDLRKWRAAHLEELDQKSFAKLMSEVYDVMGVSGADNKEKSSKKTFSKDVFRLEISGPDEDHLSVIDVPGIFKNTTPGLTSKEDIEIVRDMVLGYMQNPRSIMLTVIPANVDIATQEILEMARELDPEGNRTLGVLTKPDLVDKGAEVKVMELVDGNKSDLTLGWSIVRNPGQQQLLESNTDRDNAEARFFRDESPWNSLDKDKVGIRALRTRLQEIQTAHIRREFPKVRLEVNKKLKSKKNELLGLGTERDTSEKQSNYLLDIVAKFQELTSQALATNYSNDLFDENSDLRLATVLRNRCEAFKDDMSNYGHEYSFASADSNQKQNGLCGPHNGEMETDSAEAVSVRKNGNLTELEGILYDQEILPLPSDDDILDWIEKLYRTSRGFEIGTFSPLLLSTIMRKQSSKWTALALGYISDAVSMIHNFLVRVLERVCPDDRIRGNLLSVLMDDLLIKYKNAVEQVEFLLHVERHGTLMTLNDFLQRNIEDACEKRRYEKQQLALDGSAAFENLRITVEANDQMSNTRHTAQYIHDILESYYEIAAKRFVDNVCMQAADYYLVTGPSTPLKLLAPSLITRMTPEQLESIAGENAMVKRKRSQLKKEIEELEMGRKILL
ncbi:DYNc [Aspergillus sclerotialis]|uniref:DYNc n=1 Tax=Aspergillus sclerotialis TaxID=2070753 RepID=A0A3A2ZL50_9EURO|nr:DYNc [Aspergillus sclerotialis]